MASKSLQADAEDDEQRGFIASLTATITNAILTPIRPFLSRAALKTYLTTFLLLSTAFVLLGFAITAYVLFYWSYIPRIGFERTIHLQFDSVYENHYNELPKVPPYPYPYGSAVLASDIVASQGYDIWIELSMPRTQDNQDAGNFMLDVNMYAPSEKGDGLPTSGNIIAPLKADISPTSPTADPALLLATSRRSAILPYRSPWVDLIHKATELHWYLLGFRSESATLKVPIFERVAFAKGFQNVPSTLRLEIQSTHRLQIYSAKALFRARFRGVRWVMYNHRILSAIFFISAFWMTEILFAGLAWLGLHLILSKPAEQDRAEVKAEEVSRSIKREAGVKEEEEVKPELSDTERTFPSFTGQPALRYHSPPTQVKQEAEDEHAVMIPEKAVEADDEDEEVDDFLDSGIGTSLESSGPARRESMRRRRGRAPVAGVSPNGWHDGEDERHV
ncbi:seipin homolog [Lecanosticta acicola]|uniref:Seipin homolog n=1 Tax=Lecanosticta acicola TaxID=111012 RepID=A0AAI8YVG5_9PEZI|nr:seipin homolog [Lecanosticta acicola]